MSTSCGTLTQQMVDTLTHWTQARQRESWIVRDIREQHVAPEIVIGGMP